MSDLFDASGVALPKPPVPDRLPFITIQLDGPRIVHCAGCGHEIICENHAVSMNECGEPTREETTYGHSVCKAYHDVFYGLGTSMAKCPLVIQGAKTYGR